VKILNYESFLETMQFAALSNAQKLAKEEEDRRKKKQEQEKTDSSKETNTQEKPVYRGEEDMGETEGQEEMETEGQEEMETGGEEAEMETEN
jgi:hypothetical protein